MKIDKRMIIALKIIRDNSDSTAKDNVRNSNGIYINEFQRICGEKGINPPDSITSNLYKNGLIFDELPRNDNATPPTLVVLALTPAGVLFLMQVENLDIAKYSYRAALVALVISLLALIFSIVSTNNDNNHTNDSRDNHACHSEITR
jgi:hypothetical protein